MVRNLLILTSVTASTFVFSQKNFWNQVQNRSSLATTSLLERQTMPTDYKIYHVNLEGLKSELANAPGRYSNNESLVLKFPTSTGDFKNYIITEAPVLSKELADKYPGIKSYIGYEKGKEENTIRFSVSPYDGINIMYFDRWEASFLEGYTKDQSNYIIYSKSSQSPSKDPFYCGFESSLPENQISINVSALKAPLVNDKLLRKYRLALACTTEYATYHIDRAGLSDGTETEKKAAVLAAMNTTMTRVNGVYEKTVSLTMEIIPNNDKIIFVDPSVDDGYTNDKGGEMLSQNQTIINKNIGTANYDIGHVFSTGGGGVAYLQSPCGSLKAGGVTGSSTPRGDAFDIDYVAHEMGHQFGGNHTFRANTSNCAGNANDNTAVEPGSGSTIMAYAGICGATNNVQSNSDPYFHSVSVQEIYSFITNKGNCSNNTPNNNNAPTSDAGSNYTIPYSTPFVLTGNGTDPDGDSLTYLWEQIDHALLANNPQPPVSTSTVGTTFRSYLPVATNKRYFPKMSYILANNLAYKWEMMPSVARSLKFSLLVNDEKATGNQSARSEMTVTVANAGPFKVTSQTVNEEINGGSNITVTWDVAGTNAAPINTQNVQILLATDVTGTGTNANANFTTVLAESVPNNGSATVTLPNISTSTARLMVKAVDNIYFAVNSSVFRIKEDLAVNDAAFKKGFALYPNPAKGEFNITLDKANKSAKYQILDLSGKLISQGNLENTDNKINISSLKTGTYRVVILNNGETTSKNLIVK